MLNTFKKFPEFYNSLNVYLYEKSEHLIKVQKKEIKFASFCGFSGGIAPDIDVLIKSDSNPLLFIEYHRHFTHSLLFAPFGVLIVSLFLYLIFIKQKKLTQKLLTKYC